MFILENNVEEEIMAPTQMGEEELVNLKEQDICVEMLHNIDPHRCEIFVHALVGVSCWRDDIDT